MLFLEQDGIFGALHTVSKDGAANYLDQPATARQHGMPVWGYDFPPGRVAMQALPSPWAPSWVSGLIDNKPVPFEETAAETTRGNFKPPLWRRVMDRRLSEHYRGDLSLANVHPRARARYGL